MLWVRHLEVEQKITKQKSYHSNQHYLLTNLNTEVMEL